MKKKLIAVLQVASMATRLVACGNKSAATEGVKEVAPIEATNIDKDTITLRLNLELEPDYLEPFLNSLVDGACLGIYTYDENNNCVPHHAYGE